MVEHVEDVVLDGEGVVVGFVAVDGNCAVDLLAGPPVEVEFAIECDLPGDVG